MVYREVPRVLVGHYGVLYHIGLILPVSRTGVSLNYLAVEAFLYLLVALVCSVDNNVAGRFFRNICERDGFFRAVACEYSELIPVKVLFRKPVVESETRVGGFLSS